MLKADAKALEEIMEKAQNDMTNQLLEIPNIPCEQVPEGKDAADNVVVKEGGEKPNLGRGRSLPLGSPEEVQPR